jgi:hypothetical protein
VSIEALLSEQKAVVQHVQQPFFWFAKWVLERKVRFKKIRDERIGYFAILQSNGDERKGKKKMETYLKQGES